MILGEVEGDLLPEIGSKVLIHLNSSDTWVEHTVVGYYVWASHEGHKNLHRVFVRVVDEDGILNARSLSDIKIVDPEEEKRIQKIHSMCKTFRHDYGILPEDEAKALYNRMEQVYDNELVGYK